jgi:hypothetical protein
MSQTCRVCYRLAHNKFLCPACTGTLRRHLIGLPRFLGYLDDAAVGNVQLSAQGGVSVNDFVVSGFTFDTRAADLAVDIRNTLTDWASKLAWTHGLAISPPIGWHRSPSEYVYTAADYAVFLVASIEHLVMLSNVADLYRKLDDQIKRGLVIINRAVPHQFCGPCPSIITGHSKCTECSKRDHDCGTRLMAKPGAIEVTCPTCGSVHNVEALTTHLLARADHHRCTIPELYRVLRMLREPVGLSTLYRWAEPKTARRGSGQLKPAGYLRKGTNNIMLTKKSGDDQAVYRVSEARKRRIENQEAKHDRKKRRAN